MRNKNIFWAAALIVTALLAPALPAQAASGQGSATATVVTPCEINGGTVDKCELRTNTTQESRTETVIDTGSNGDASNATTATYRLVVVNFE